MKNKLDIFIDHLNKFNVQVDPLMDSFIDYASKVEYQNIEISIKYQNGKLYPGRCYVWFYKEQYEALKSMLSFFERIIINNGVKIDFSEYRKLMKIGFDFNLVESVVLGIDSRDTIDKSRMKIGVIVNDNTKIVSQSANYFNENELLASGYFNEHYLFGFHFQLNNRTMVRAYPRISEKQLYDDKIIKLINKYMSEKSIKLARECKCIHVSIDKVCLSNKNYTVHYHPKNVEQFLGKVNLPSRVKEINLENKSLPIVDYVISMYDDELTKEKVENINCYWFI